MNNNNLSPYKIVWIEYIPSKGYVTKHDQKVLGALDAIDKLKSFKMCYPSKEAAMNFLRNFRKRLDKIIDAIYVLISNSAWLKKKMATKSHTQKSN